MKICRSKISLFVALFGLWGLSPTTAWAQDDAAVDSIGNISPGFKATERRNMLIIGTANSLDTYLSPLTYRGTELRFTSQVVHNRKERNWTHTLTHGLRLARETMHTNEGIRLEGGYDFS